MTFVNLQSFTEALRRQGDLVDIDAPVDANLEIAEIHRRVIAAGGPALLFHRVKGKRFPVLTNMFGTKARVDLAFGQRPKDLIKQIARLPEELLPPSLRKLWGFKGLGKDLLKVGMRRRGQAPVLQHSIPMGDLTELPAIKSWQLDGGPFLTLPLVHTPGRDGKPDNLGMYRIQIHDKAEAGLHFQIGKGGGYHLQLAEEKGRDLPVTIHLGGPPALILAAIAPLPENVPEILLASLLLGDRLDRPKDWRDQAPAPVAESEFCLVGYAPPQVRRPEGPFGDHYGYYSWKHDYPVFRSKAIYHRPGAIFPATVVGKPRQEDFFLGDYLQELLLPVIPLVMPSLTDIWSYGETGYHSLAAAVLKERYGREALTASFRILGEGQLSLTKFLLGVDRPMDLQDFKGVLTYVLERADFNKDLYVFSDTAMDTLDYTGPAVNKGSKGVLLGTGDAKRQLPNVIGSDIPEQLIRDARIFCPGCIVVETASYKGNEELAADVATLSGLQDWPLVVMVDNAVKATHSVAAFLWTTFTRFNPAADIHSAGTRLHKHKISYDLPVVIDARFKPWYPDELFCDETTAALVSSRWQEYFGRRRVEMGDSTAGHLYR